MNGMLDSRPEELDEIEAQGEGRITLTKVAILTDAAKLARESIRFSARLNFSPIFGQALSNAWICEGLSFKPVGGNSKACNISVTFHFQACGWRIVGIQPYKSIEFRDLIDLIERVTR